MSARHLAQLGSIFAILLAFGACDRHPTPAPSPTPTEAPATGPKKIHVGDLELFEVLTAGARADDVLPMIVAIHGMGDRPENWLDFFASFPIPARVFLPRAPTPYGEGSSWFTYPPKSEALLAAEIGAAGDRVAAVMKILASAKTKGKPIVTGFSQGGFLSFDLAVHHADVIGAAFPMSGGLPAPARPHADASAPRLAPIFAVHGTADTLVPISLARDTVAEIVARGGHAELHEFPGVGHTVTAAMHDEVLQRIARSLQDGDSGAW